VLRPLSLFLALLVWPLAGSPQSLALRGPVLAAASNFGQGWHPEILAAAAALGVRDFRDEIYWERIEGPDRRYRFDQFMTAYPKMIGATGGTLSLLTGGGHPKFDGGDTPHSRNAVRAFGAMAAATVARFAAITSVEVGNEFNGDDFVSGPVRKTQGAERAAAYLALLQSSYRQIKQARPDVQVIGGSVLAIPAGYLQQVADLNAAAFMDALSIHPYTTKPQHLARQIAVLRRIPAFQTIPIEVTEYGDPDAATAPATLLKAYCQFALSGVTRFVWYPLSDRGDGLTPLLTSNGRTTDTGRAFAFVQHQLTGLPAQDVAPDPFVSACRFGPNRLVIWGAPRTLTLPPQARVFTATGAALDPAPTRIDAARPVLIVSPDPIVVGENLLLGPTGIIADSKAQFVFPGGPVDPVRTDPFYRFTRRAGTETPMLTDPGQREPGSLWTPFLADPNDSYIRLTESFLRPDGSAENPVEVVHRYTVPRDMVVDIHALWSLRPDMGDGVTVKVTLNAQPLAAELLRNSFAYNARRLALAKGDILEFAVGPNGNATGDLVDYHIRIQNPAE